MAGAVLCGLALTGAPGAEIWFFLLEDCAVSRYYVPEIARICEEGKGAGMHCTVWLVNESLSDRQATEAATGMGLARVEVRVDRGQEHVRRSGATVTPEAAVYTADGRLAYRGRIDDTFFGWGRRRGAVTERNLRDAVKAALDGAVVAGPWPEPVGCYIEKRGEVK